MSDNSKAKRSVLVAGATGAVGRQLLPMLVRAGYEVFGTTRDPRKAAQIEAIGARPVLVDVFHRAALIKAVGEAHPDVIIHQLTDLTAADFAANDRLRIVGTRNLVDAAKAAGVRRMIAQSLAIVYAHKPEPATENDPLADETPEVRDTVKGVRALEAAVSELPEGVILRYGFFYGPGTWYSENGPFADSVRRAGRPAGRGSSSFIHVKDAARAAMYAIDWPPGVFNIVDDDPAIGTEWLPVFAAAIGAPAPLEGEFSGYEQAASNKKVRQELGWKPLHPTWREGFRTALD
ncbi:NAD-dependent epimerase/dehydratase family protein [Hyphomicrobium facile]|uniref:Nucleoside-diphosphate-sugar epimerase n=1 Tax=Hyphomicrobium facile TaxID=51670 RepID=A0A1I7NH82_9HYPH|nr:NAD(P)-dependent oxidoreductase [Hyphomicrobium facile]SFV34012.1 Nucleoside-diphosphate-sugar epimerase [Hyphomicrobium facile]